MNMEPFDFGNINVVEALYHRNIYFFEHEDDPTDLTDQSYMKAHQQYVAGMLEAGWTLGPEDYETKNLTDLKPYEELSEEERKDIAFRAAIVHSAKGFYRSIRAEIEADLMESIQGNVFSTRKAMSHMVH